VDVAPDPASPYNLLGALLAYGTLAISIACTNQQAVQRYLSCRDAGAARRAALLGWGIGFVAVGLTLFLGASLFAWSELAPGGAVLAGAGDEALPRFIGQRLPPGISGLMLAAIFAASMSSMDSAIHSMSTATLVDFVRRFRRRPLEGGRELRLARLLTVAFGLLATGIALLAARGDALLLELLITWLGYFAGPLLGLFLLGLLTRRANEAGALVGVLVAGGSVLAAVLAEIPRQHGFHPLWLAPASCALTLAAGRLASLAFPAPRPEDLDGLTWWDRATPRRPGAGRSALPRVPPPRDDRPRDA
jgi:SSS family solute:Na+ symporter